LTSRKRHQRLPSYNPNSALKDEPAAGKTANCPVQATPPRKYLAVSLSDRHYPEFKEALSEQGKQLPSIFANRAFEKQHMEMDALNAAVTSG